MRPTAPTPSPWLRLARWVVLALLAVSLLAVLASFLLAPAYVRDQKAGYALNVVWTPELVETAQRQLGWPMGAVAGIEFARSAALYLGTLVPGLLILRRKSSDMFGLYVAFAFAVAPAPFAMRPLVDRLPALGQFVTLSGAVSWQLYFMLFYVFPNGRFVPRWTRWLIPVWIGMNFIPGMGNPAADAGLLASLPWLTLLPFVLVLSAVGSQVYRYFWRSNAIERQQTKWVVLALAILAVAAIWSDPNLPPPAPGTEGAALVRELAQLWMFAVGFVIVPLVMAVAILRYRLWDVDLLIRRTLIYSVLTGLLALMYFGSVIVLEGMLRGLTGGQSPLVIVLSTLLIAALFVPVRSRVQAFIDRRFYRRKYDAAKTLAAFAASARDETDLPHLNERLVNVVNETMQPASVGLWLRPPAPVNGHDSAGHARFTIAP